MSQSTQLFLPKRKNATHSSDMNFYNIQIQFDMELFGIWQQKSEYIKAILKGQEDVDSYVMFFFPP